MPYICLQSGRASQAEKTLERIKAEGLIEKPFVPKKRSFTFPPVEKMGQKARLRWPVTCFGYGCSLVFLFASDSAWLW